MHQMRVLLQLGAARQRADLSEFKRERGTAATRARTGCLLCRAAFRTVPGSSSSGVCSQVRAVR